MRAAARIFAIAAVVVAGFGVWKLYGLDPDDERYGIGGAATLRAPDQLGLTNFLRDQKRWTSVVLLGTILQFVSILLSTFTGHRLTARSLRGHPPGLRSWCVIGATPRRDAPALANVT